MEKIAYIDDNIALGMSYKTKNYNEIRKIAQNYRDAFVVEENGEVYGFCIKKNHPLTKVYGFDCYVVKFIFSSITALHDEQQEFILKKVCEKLSEAIQGQQGYYNIRIPIHLVDLLRAFNQTFSNIIFCGGTVEEIHFGNLPDYEINSNLDLFFADKAYIVKNQKTMEEQAYKSFKNYQGQYHISPVTSFKAGEIYKDWISNSFNNFSDNTVLVAEYNERVVGYCTLRENEYGVDAILSSVDFSFRNLGAYKAMIFSLISYAKSKRKIFVTSTQFDNYIVQGTWNSLGLRPFYSIYNFHIDNR